MSQTLQCSRTAALISYGSRSPTRYLINMGKAKPKPKPKSQAKTRLGLAAQQKHAPKKVNPFELKKTKSNFETMGRRTKGAQSNVVKARQEAITKVRRYSVRSLPKLVVQRTACIVSNISDSHLAQCLTA